MYRRSTFLPVIVAAVTLATPVIAQAAPKKFTLDGASKSESTARAGDNMCSVVNEADPDTMVCFTNEREAEVAMRRDLRANRVPAGFVGGMPPEKKKAELLAGHDDETASASRRSRRPRARAANHCGRDYNNIWTGGNFNDNHGYYGYTTGVSYVNFSNPWYNEITSYKHAHFFTDQFDYFNGGGDYYGGGNAVCSEAQSLATGNPFWNNKIGSADTF